MHSCMKTIKLGRMLSCKMTHFIHLVHTIYHLIPIFPSIKPLIFTTFIINMGLYYHFPNHLFFEYFEWICGQLLRKLTYFQQNKVGITLLSRAHLSVETESDSNYFLFLTRHHYRKLRIGLMPNICVVNV